MPALISKEAINKLVQFSHSLHEVCVSMVPAARENSFIRKAREARAGTAETVDDSEEEAAGGAISRRLYFRCDCPVFWQNADHCSHTLIAADHEGVISFEKLLGAVAPRNKVGRPRKHHTGSCRQRDSATAPPVPRHSPEWWLGQVRRHGALHYHGWRVVRSGSQGSQCVGKIHSFREQAPARGQTRGTKLWMIHFDGYAEGDNAEELTDVELAGALAAATALGVDGPPPATA